MEWWQTTLTIFAGIITCLTLWDKIESAPNSPSANGDYVLRHNNRVNTYVADTKELPTGPTTDGTYVLKATVSSGTATLSWVAE